MSKTVATITEETNLNGLFLGVVKTTTTEKSGSTTVTLGDQPVQFKLGTGAGSECNLREGLQKTSSTLPEAGSTNTDDVWTNLTVPKSPSTIPKHTLIHTKGKPQRRHYSLFKSCTEIYLVSL